MHRILEWVFGVVKENDRERGWDWAIGELFNGAHPKELEAQCCWVGQTEYTEFDSGALAAPIVWLSC